MAESLHAILASVSSRTVGDLADATASIGGTVVSVGDACDFDEDGGWLTINGTAYPYVSVDMEADTVKLGTALTGAVAVGDAVSLWDIDNAVIVTEATALVTVDGQDDGDPIRAVIDHSLNPLLAQGTFVAGQSVSVTRDGEEWTLTRVHAKSQVGLQRSLTNYYQAGIDNFDGTVTGLEVDASTPPTIVRLIAQPGGGVKVQQSDRSTYLAIRASAFTVSSDPDVKTKPTDPPDALSIIAAAPAKEWRYLTDEDDVRRIGPMADTLPDWLVQADTQDGTLGIDQARMVGVLWRAVEQLSERLAALEKPNEKGV